MIDTPSPYADFEISNALVQLLQTSQFNYRNLVFFCIGTTQVSGDTLGPLIGTQIQNLHLPHTIVYGTWEEPVHALNLTEKWANAKKKHPDSCFIAIDASFGPKSHLGNICIRNCPIYPGLGVGKNLPAVGDISITGIVCANCLMRHRQLQNIPFSNICAQANVIVNGIFQTLFYFFL